VIEVKLPEIPDIPYEWVYVENRGRMEPSTEAWPCPGCGEPMCIACVGNGFCKHLVGGPSGKPCMFIYPATQVIAFQRWWFRAMGDAWAEEDAEEEARFEAEVRQHVAPEDVEAVIAEHRADREYRRSPAGQAEYWQWELERAIQAEHVLRREREEGHL